MPDLVVGSIPRGEDYFGQEDLIEALWDRLRKDNVLLAAPRRFGKIGAMFRLLDAPQDLYRPLYIDVEGITTAADFMVELMAALFRDHHFSRVLRGFWEGTKDFGAFLRDLPTDIDVGGVKIALRERTEVTDSWLSYGEQVMQRLAREEPRLLLMIDEFAIMASSIHDQQGRDELARFLRWFRAARLAPETKTRFVLGSSINLLDMLDSLGLVDTVNDLRVERLKPFSEATAARFIEQIFADRGVALEPEVRDELLALVGTPIPYLLAVLLTAVFDRRRAEKSETVSVEMVRAAFEEDLLGGATSATFHHYRSRLDEYYSKSEARVARVLLGALSRNEEGIGRGALYQIFLKTMGETPDVDQSEAFVQLMNKLENDFYIVQKDERFAFYSRVLGAWWKARYGFVGA